MRADGRTDPRWRSCAHAIVGDRCSRCRAIVIPPGDAPQQSRLGPGENLAGVSIGRMTPIVTGTLVVRGGEECVKGHVGQWSIKVTGYRICQQCHRESVAAHKARTRAA